MSKAELLESLHLLFGEYKLLTRRTAMDSAGQKAWAELNIFYISSRSTLFPFLATLFSTLGLIHLAHKTPIALASGWV